MKATITLKNLAIEVEGSTQIELFEKVSGLVEVFGELRCGKCQGTETAFCTREVDGVSFHEIQCLDQKCRARLSLGSHKVGKSMFPKRRDDEGGWLPNGGWTIYVPKNKGPASADPKKK